MGRATPPVGLAVVAGAVIVAGLLPTAAGAAITYKHQRFTVAPGLQSAPVVVECPRGLHVTSGGVGMTVGNAVVNQSLPIDRGDADGKPDDGWQTVISNLSVGGDERATAWAICSTTEPRYRLRETTVTGEAPTRVECPGPSRATGAGAAMAGPLDQSYLRAWAPFEFGGDGRRAVNVLVKGSPAAPIATLAAVCSNERRLRYVRDEFEVPGPMDVVGPEELQCPRDHMVLGGGAYPLTPGVGTELDTTDSFPTDGIDEGQRPDDVWIFTTADSAGTTTQVRAVAVCVGTEPSGAGF